MESWANGYAKAKLTKRSFDLGQRLIPFVPLQVQIVLGVAPSGAIAGIRDLTGAACRSLRLEGAAL